ncbi:CNNM domain-containing protein [Haloglomus litoreum]|uniref:CNNM domain-containing protein n=1 Tax=Haloglomus litoreum TaxID=3034026 RepID=UPI0023E8041F|nr:hemolysin family protein [Haloglomus sp. DT116]
MASSAALVGLRLIGGVVLLFANGFFVTTEFAMTRVRQFAREEFTGHPGLDRAWEMTERLEIYLSGCQVGITVSSVGLGVVAEPALTAAIDPLFRAVGFSAGGASHAAISVIVALALINILHVIIGEQAPTYLGVERSKFVAKHGARPLYYWTKLMSPVILFADWVAKKLLGAFGVTISRAWAEEEIEGEEGGDRPSDRADLRAAMGERMRALGVPADRREEVMNALYIDRVQVQDVMVDAEAITPLSVQEPLEVNVERIREHPHTRFPLVGEDVSDFRGIVYVPAVLRDLDDLEAGELTLSDLAADPMTVPADLSVADLIDRFQDEKQELALVVDPDGETTVLGLVTATDAFEAITGELEDPLDEETPPGLTADPTTRPAGDDASGA